MVGLGGASRGGAPLQCVSTPQPGKKLGIDVEGRPQQDRVADARRTQAQAVDDAGIFDHVVGEEPEPDVRAAHREPAKVVGADEVDELCTASTRSGSNRRSAAMSRR
jgi:hypothetical protein